MRKFLIIIAVTGLIGITILFGGGFRSKQEALRPFVLKTTAIQYDSNGNALWLRNERTAVDRIGNVTVLSSLPGGRVSYLATLASGGQYFSNGKVTGELVSGKNASLAYIPHHDVALKTQPGFVGMSLQLGIPTYVNVLEDPQGETALYQSPMTSGLPLKVIAKRAGVTVVVEPSAIEFRNPTAEEMWHP